MSGLVAAAFGIASSLGLTSACGVKFASVVGTMPFLVIGKYEMYREIYIEIERERERDEIDRKRSYFVNIYFYRKLIQVYQSISMIVVWDSLIIIF